MADTRDNWDERRRRGRRPKRRPAVVYRRGNPDNNENKDSLYDSATDELVFHNYFNQANHVSNFFKTAICSQTSENGQEAKRIDQGPKKSNATCS